jgi:hypothetical protein
MNRRQTGSDQMRSVVAAKLSFILFSIVLAAAELTAIDLARAQVIESGNATIDPTSKIHLKGQFPTDARIKIHFNQPSAVAFQSSGTNSDLYLDFEAQPNSTEVESKQRIDEANPLGDVPEQTVDITVETTEHGGGANRFVTTNKWQAKFENKAVIVQCPATVGYNTSFNLSGWDFGEPGKLKIHFANNAFGSGAVDNNLDLKMPPPNWTKGWVINDQVGQVGGLIEQPVEISFTTKDGRTSEYMTTDGQILNDCPAKFKPLIVQMPVPWTAVQVISCSNEATGNGCNAMTDSGGCFLPPLIPFGEGATSLSSVQGAHIACWGFSSDNGTDQYWVNVNNGVPNVNDGWQIVLIDAYPPDTSNGSVQFSTSAPPNIANPGSIASGNDGFVFAGSYAPLPSQQVNLYVNWHIGASGGAVEYFADFTIKGPYGVPY